MRTETAALAFVEGYASRELTEGGKKFLRGRRARWIEQGFTRATDAIDALLGELYDPFADRSLDERLPYKEN